jgi:hypothetical protein
MIDEPRHSDEWAIIRPHFGIGRWIGGSIACAVLTLLLGSFGTVQAQQLEPRAYSPAPIGLNFLGLSYLYSYGGSALDPSSPIQNVYARVSSVVPYYGRTFGLFGRQASVTGAVPYVWGTIHGDVYDVGSSIDRSGFGDPQVRLAVNLLGGPAMTPVEYAQHKPKTTLGASLTVVAPFGHYDPSKLINIGTNRWAFKPELGLSQPVGNWAFELYAGVWLFEDNEKFFGGQVKRQDPLAAFQTHIVYEVSPRLWAAFDFTYYTGGATTVNGQHKDDRQDNTRTGLTLSLPVKRNQSLKLVWTQGVTTRIGSSFDTLGATWQLSWF